MADRFFQGDWTDGKLTVAPATKLAGGAAFEGNPVASAMRSQVEPGSLSRRVLLRVGNVGNPVWVADEFEPGSLPTPTNEQTIARVKVHVTQGCSLRVSLLHIGTAIVSGTGEPNVGHVNVNATWSSTANANNFSTQVSLSCPGGPGKALPEGGSEVPNLYKLAGVMTAEATIQREDSTLGPEDQNDYDAEQCEIDILVTRVGSPRIVDLVVTEVPNRMTKEDDSPDDDWVGPIFEDGGGPPRLYHPVEEVSTVAGREDPRRGTRMILDCARATGRRLGPILATWSAYNEGATASDTSEIDPVSTASSTPIVLGSLPMSSGANALGISVSHPIATGGSGAIPVRVRVYARSTTSTGVVTVQTSDHQVVTVDIDGTSYAWFESHCGTLEVGRQPGQFITALVEYFDTSGTIDLRYIVIEREPNSTSW